MGATILHVSDLHCGSADPEADRVAGALRELAAALRPDLVVASGDLTHRNRAAEHAAARELLGSLDLPVLAVPGNHDIPALPPARWRRPFAAFGGQWPAVEPEHVSDELVVCGLCSVRGWLYQEGTLRAAQLERARRVLGAASAGALRVVVIHHHLVSPPWRTAKLPVLGRDRVLGGLAAAGAELVLSGHTHQAAVAIARDFRIGLDGPVLVNAPGLGRPRPGRHGEARGVHVIASTASSLAVTTHVWRDGGFVAGAEHRFERAARPATSGQGSSSPPLDDTATPDVPRSSRDSSRT